MSDTHTYGGNESGAEGTDNAIDLTSCREDMRGLWADRAVGVVLKKRKILCEDSGSDAHLSLMTHRINLEIRVERIYPSRTSAVVVVENAMVEQREDDDDVRKCMKDLFHRLLYQMLRRILKYGCPLMPLQLVKSVVTFRRRQKKSIPDPRSCQ